MLNYLKISYSDKLIALQDKFKFSTKLAEHLAVSRQSLINWKDDDSSINDENRLKIDVAYCEYFGFDSIKVDDISDIQNKINKIDFSYFNIEEVDIVDRVSKTIAFGSLEIEEDVKQKDFNKIVEQHELISDMDKRDMLSINNLANLTVKVIKDTLNSNIEQIDPREIKNWHYSLMNGIRTDAGEYSKHKRIIPGSEELTLTDYRDIKEEIQRWCDMYDKDLTLDDITKAHAHFELIHPFGDGNGRVGRLIVSHQCIKAGLIPPLINNSNKALYYVFLKHAQVNNEYSYLKYFLATAILETHRKFGN